MNQQQFILIHVDTLSGTHAFYMPMFPGASIDFGLQVGWLRPRRRVMAPLVCGIVGFSVACDAFADTASKEGVDPLGVERLQALSRAEETASNSEALIRLKDEIVARLPVTLHSIGKVRSLSQVLPTDTKDLPEHEKLFSDFTSALIEIETSARTQEEIVARKDELIALNRETLIWCKEQQAKEVKALVAKDPPQNPPLGAGDSASMDRIMIAVERIGKNGFSPEERIKQLDEALKQISND